jgi:hypothetical protein
MQGINVFADAAARTAAITSPQEGQYSYLKDSNSLWYYSGSAWVAAGGSPLTTKGDIYGYNTTDARIPVGANNTVLTADSAEALGVKWATPAASGMTSLATGTLSGTSVVLSSINQTYQSLYLVINGASVAATATPLIVRQNAITTNYAVTENITDSTTITNSTTLTGYRPVTTYNVPTGVDNQTIFTYFWPQYYKTTQHPVSLFATDLSKAFSCICFTDNNAAISSITITTVAGSTFDAGTYTLYGVK